MIKHIKEDLKKALEHNRRAEDFIEKANAQLSILEDTEEDPEPAPAVTDISIKTEPHKIIISLKSEEELDIQYRFIPQKLKEGELNPEKIHSVVGYIKDVDEDKPIKIWVGRNGIWEVQIISLDSDYKSEIYTVKVPDAEVVRPTPNPDPVPAPDPIPEPAPDTEYNIEIDTKHSIESGRTFPAGTPINYVVDVTKDGNPAEGEVVVFEFPDGDRKAVTGPRGSGVVHKYILPTGGLNMKVYLESDPDTYLQWVTKATGSHTPLPREDEEIPVPEEPEDENDREYRFDKDGHKIHLSGYVPKKPVVNINTNIPIKKGNITVGVLFLSKNFQLPPRTRVLINNTWYDFRGRTDFDFRIKGRPAGGFLINLKQKFHQAAVHPMDIWKQDRGNHGYMNLSWKVLAKHRNYDFHNIVTNDREHPNFWAGADHGGIMQLRHGWNSIWRPRPDFWSFKTHDNVFGNFSVFNRFNETNKFLIIIGDPTSWKEQKDRHDWHPVDSDKNIPLK